MSCCSLIMAPCIQAFCCFIACLFSVTMLRASDIEAVAVPSSVSRVDTSAENAFCWSCRRLHSSVFTAKR